MYGNPSTTNLKMLFIQQFYQINYGIQNKLYLIKNDVFVLKYIYIVSIYIKSCNYSLNYMEIIK